MEIQTVKYACSCRAHAAAAQPCAERRQLLGLALLGALAATTGLSACGEREGAGAGVVPMEIDATTSCSLDGMLLADYPGPKAQIHYAGQATPVFFCDTVELFNTVLRPEQVRKVVAMYVQDMGQTSWEQPRGHWIDARSAYYVLGSKRPGSMGPTIGSFAQEADARKFIEQWKGRLLRFDEIKPEMVDLSGGALHDTRM
jgi:copper chaperone NosL